FFAPEIDVETDRELARGTRRSRTLRQGFDARDGDRIEFERIALLGRCVLPLVAAMQDRAVTDRDPTFFGRRGTRDGRGARESRRSGTPLGDIGRLGGGRGDG